MRSLTCDLLGAFVVGPNRSSQQLYIWERQIEVLARHLLLLQVAQDWELPIRQRANVFLEIFGNCLVQVMTICDCSDVECSKIVCRILNKEPAVSRFGKSMYS